MAQILRKAMLSIRGLLQVVTSGIGWKADVIFIGQEALLIFMTMHQGHYESNNEYLKHFKSIVITLKVSDREHHVYDAKLCQKVANIGDVTPSKYEKEKYIDRYMAMNYFRRADEHSYSDL